MQLRGNQEKDRLAHDLFRRVPEELCGGVIPACDAAVEIFADDGVVGGLDDGRKLGEMPGGCVLVSFCQAQVVDLAGQFLTKTKVFNCRGSLGSDCGYEVFGLQIEDADLFVSVEE